MTKKLWELPRGSKLYESISGTVAGVYHKTSADTEPLIFAKVDGLYASCYLESDHDMVVYISANAPVKKYKDGYKIAEEDNNAVDKLTQAKLI